LKRFTETTKWDDPWFMDLPVKYKLFWLYICDRCDIAGFWEPNMRLAVAQIGEPIELVEILRVFEKRIEQIRDGKLWIKKFVQFQQGTELNPANNAHRGIINRFNENKVSSPLPIQKKELAPAKGLPESYHAPPEGLARTPGKGTSKGTSKEEGSAEGRNIILTKYGYPLPPRCSIRRTDGAVLDYSGRVMDINDVRKASRGVQ
jgi:hypothetical protein